MRLLLDKPPIRFDCRKRVSISSEVSAFGSGVDVDHPVGGLACEKGGQGDQQPVGRELCAQHGVVVDVKVAVDDRGVAGDDFSDDAALVRGGAGPRQRGDRESARAGRRLRE